MQKQQHKIIFYRFHQDVIKLKCLTFSLDGEGGIVAEKNSLGSKTSSRYATLQDCHDGNGNILSETKGVITKEVKVSA